MLKGFKDMLTLISYVSSVLVQCITSLAQAVTSQAEKREPIKSVFIMVMPKYLFRINNFKNNLVNSIKENNSMNDKLGFENSACDITDSFPSPVTR